MNTSLTYYFDIDGTLADSVVDISNVDPDKITMDYVRTVVETNNDGGPLSPISELAKALHAYGHEIVVCTARSEIFRESTEYWLNKHNIPYVELYMRKEGDVRHDVEVKKSLLQRAIDDGYDINSGFEDRKDVTEALREEFGLVIAQIG